MISTSNEVFSEYLGILDALMSYERRTLYIGPLLGRMQIPGSIRVQKTSFGRYVRETGKLQRCLDSTWRHGETIGFKLIHVVRHLSLALLIS